MFQSHCSFTLKPAVIRDRSYEWVDGERKIVQTQVYKFGEIELHFPDTPGHFVKMKLPSGEMQQIGVVMSYTPPTKIISPGAYPGRKKLGGMNNG